MEFILIDILFRPIGWVILHCKYRNKVKVQAVLKSTYDNDYANVSKNTLFGLVILVLALAIIALIVVSVFRLIFPV